jgi:hypothetical protein
LVFGAFFLEGIGFNHLFANQSASIPVLPLRIRASLALELEQFLSSSPLRIISVANLEPGGTSIEQIRVVFPLGNDALEISFAYKIEQLLAGAFDVIAIQQPLSGLWNYAAQPMLAVGEDR